MMKYNALYIITVYSIMTKSTTTKSKAKRTRNPNPTPQCSRAGRALRYSKGKTAGSTAAGRALRSCSLRSTSSAPNGSNALNASAIKWAANIGASKLVTALQNMQKPGFKAKPLMMSDKALFDAIHQPSPKPKRKPKYYPAVLRESTRVSKPNRRYL